MKILMVCLGNICRSPLAEGILKEKAKQAGYDWTIKSAGTNSYHTGEPPHELSQKVALENGIDISRQVARRFVKTDFAEYDRIYSMAADVLQDMKKIAGNEFNSNKVALLMDASNPGEHLDIPDPWAGPEAGYHKAFAMINKACDAIIENYMTHSTKTAD